MKKQPLPKLTNLKPNDYGNKPLNVTDMRYTIFYKPIAVQEKQTGLIERLIERLKK